MGRCRQGAERGSPGKEGFFPRHLRESPENGPRRHPIPPAWRRAPRVGILPRTDRSPEDRSPPGSPPADHHAYVRSREAGESGPRSGCFPLRPVDPGSEPTDRGREQANPGRTPDHAAGGPETFSRHRTTGPYGRRGFLRRADVQPAQDRAFLPPVCGLRGCGYRELRGSDAFSKEGRPRCGSGREGRSQWREPRGTGKDGAQHGGALGGKAAGNGGGSAPRAEAGIFQGCLLRRLAPPFEQIRSRLPDEDAGCGRPPEPRGAAPLPRTLERPYAGRGMARGVQGGTR